MSVSGLTTSQIQEKLEHFERENDFQRIKIVEKNNEITRQQTEIQNLRNDLEEMTALYEEVLENTNELQSDIKQKESDLEECLAKVKAIRDEATSSV